jgi:hypothetical protein
MVLELARLMMGLILAAFHRPVADFILAQDRAFAGLAQRGGIRLPAGLSAEASRNLFFCLGIVVALAQMARIYVSYLHH